MKRFTRPFIIPFLSLFMVLFSVAFNRSNHLQASNTGAAMFFKTTTQSHQQVDKSEVGSTDGITIMSFVIVALIVAPIYLQRRHWARS